VTIPGKTFSSRPRDFELTDDEFNRLRVLVHSEAGISLSDAKRELVYGRLVRRLRALELDSFSAYIALLQSGEHPSEMQEFINAITTNLTSFFREPHHFEFLANTALPELVRRNAATRRIRIWSSASSTGEEPYTIAMVLRECQSVWAGYDVRILATDLDTQCVATCKRGVYGQDRVRDLPKATLAKYFEAGPQAGTHRVRDEVRELVSFGQLNLMNEWPMRGPLDIIFCRNVVIYFDKDAQRKLFQRMADLQREGAYLFLGHSETLFKVSTRYELMGRTIYRRSGP
jgi:chemotaxis protein methyltransferase CheR